MNQDLKDKRIRDLFHELGQAEERLTPDFEGVLKAALRRRKAPHRLFVWRVAAAVGLPISAFGIAVALLGSQSIESLPPVDSSMVQRLPFSPHINPNDAHSPTTPPRPPISLRPGNRRSVSRTQKQPIQISHWQAPTDFLLKTPGSEFLRNLPRMPDSEPGIPRSLPDTHN